MVETPIEGDPPSVPKGAAIGAALLAVGTLMVWAGWDPLFDGGDFGRADVFAIGAVACGVTVILGGLAVVVGIAYHLSTSRRTN